MNRRKTVSVTPAMGARTVAGRMVTGPIWRVEGNGRGTTSVAERPPSALPCGPASAWFAREVSSAAGSDLYQYFSIALILG